MGGSFAQLAGLTQDVETGAGDQGNEALAALGGSQPSAALAAAPTQAPATGGGPGGGYDPLAGIGQLLNTLNQMPTTQQPAGAQVTQRHGGLLTGLAGVLIDGLAGGMAPTAREATEMPMRMQQMAMQKQQMQLEQQKMQMEMATEPLREKAMMAQSAINILQAGHMMRQANIEHQNDMMGVQGKYMEQAIEEGRARLDATAPTMKDAQARTQELMAKNQDKFLNFGYYPSKRDDQGNPTEYGIYEAYPKGSLQAPFHYVLKGDPDLKINDEVIDIPAGTNEAEARLKVSSMANEFTAAKGIAQMKFQMTKEEAHEAQQSRMFALAFRRVTDSERKDLLSNNPATIQDLGRSMVEGEMSPTQVGKVGSRSGTQAAFYEAAQQYSQAKYGKPWDSEKALRDWNYANRGSTQDTLNMVRGMAEPDGSLDIVKKAAESLPRVDEQTLNNLFNRTATEFGSDQESNFHTAMIGFADEYAKVMGGGVGAVQNVERGMQILKSNYSKGQIEGGIQILMRDIQARSRAMIGDNPYLRKTYGALLGGGGGGTTGGGTTGGGAAGPDPFAQFGGKVWQPPTQQPTQQPQ